MLGRANFFLFLSAPVYFPPLRRSRDILTSLTTAIQKPFLAISNVFMCDAKLQSISSTIFSFLFCFFHFIETKSFCCWFLLSFLFLVYSPSNKSVCHFLIGFSSIFMHAASNSGSDTVNLIETDAHHMIVVWAHKRNDRNILIAIQYVLRLFSFCFSPSRQWDKTKWNGSIGWF